MNNKKSALIAMSGGVDSSVAAYLTVKAGYDCIGTTMRLYNNEDRGISGFHTCCSARDIEDAAEVAFELDIPYEVLDFTFDFREMIIDKFVRTYEAGGTPNPCIDCNRFMKFSKLLDFARAKGMNYVVTGHYARVEEKDGRFILKKALDETKDQSYVLYSMTQEELSHVLFPLGEMRKTETRRIAEENGFVNSHKPDSQDICFVPDGDYVSFMEQYTGKHYPEGDFLDENGNVIGRHRGIVHYTIGQRRGLGIAAGQHVYVYKKDIENNTVYVGTEEKLYTKYLTAGDVNWIAFDKPDFTIRVSAMTRYRHKEQPATLYPNADGTVSVEFDEKQRAVTPGQAVVFYDGDTVVGGGTIIEAH